MARLRLEADKAWEATGMKFGLYLIGSTMGVSGPPAAPIADPEFLADLGATRMIYSTHDPDLDSAKATLDRFATEVISRT